MDVDASALGVLLGDPSVIEQLAKVCELLVGFNFSAFMQSVGFVHREAAFNFVK